MASLQVKTRVGEKKALDVAAVDALKHRLRGALLLEGDAGYEESRKVWNGMIDRRPALISRCTGAADVIACVDFARDHALPIAVRSGGHNVAGLAVCDGGLVVDLSEMRGVRVDPVRRVATVAGGAKLGDLDHETQAFGLAVPVGVVSATGIGGLTLHGGFGWLSRKYGLSVDNLIGVDIVTADGRLRRATVDENPDLFWAVRGGGGNFGVVTSFDFRLHAVGPQVWMLLTIYPFDQAENVLRQFRTIMATAPDEMSAIAVLWSMPEVPEAPPETWGQPVLILIGCYSGRIEDGEAVLEPFRHAGTVLADLTAITRFEDMQKSLDRDYPNGMRYYWKSLNLDNLDDEAIGAVVEHAAARPSRQTSVDIWGLGGAAGRVDPAATAFGRRDAPFLLGIEANWQRAEDSEANIAWARGLYEHMMRYSRGGSYLNFPGFVEEGEQLIRASYGANYDRLRRVKAAYDPENLFSANLNITPAR